VLLVGLVMKRSLLFAAVLVAVSCVPGCSLRPKDRAKATAPGMAAGGAAALSPEEERAQKAVELLNRATELMDSIRDRNSATGVAPELKTIARQLHDLHGRGVPLGSEVNDNPQALGRFHRDMEKATRRYAAVAVRWYDRENILGPDFRDALHDLRSVVH
jgi:hypothetical protein